jgi:superfamily II DNA or RNA helicase
MLRQYQRHIHKNTLKFLKNKKGQRGQVYAPMAAGKTVMFIEAIKATIKLYNQMNRKPRICIAYPKLALIADQAARLDRVFKGSVHKNGFNSDKFIASKYVTGECSTTNKRELLDMMTYALGRNGIKAHITLVTYDSLDKIADVDFDLMICDEAHYAVQEQYAKANAKIAAKKVLYYTATPIIDEMEGRMLDQALFGDVIAQVEPKELIKLGYIVAPLIHRMDCKTKKNNEVDIVDLISRSYVEQFKEVAACGLTTHQMLVAARDIQTDVRCEEHGVDGNIKTIKNQIKVLSNGFIGDVPIYTISADCAILDGKTEMTREEALVQIKNSNKNCIIVHYDTIAEGIDIDTISGVVVMRSMSKAKFIQTMGRGGRAYVGDLDHNMEPRKDLYDPENGVDKRRKPRCILTLPVVNGEWICNKDGIKIAEAFAAAGYEDISTYMDADADDAKKSRSEDEGNVDPVDKTMANIVDYQITKVLNDLLNEAYYEAA